MKKKTTNLRFEFFARPPQSPRIENIGVGKIARGGVMGVEEALRDVLFSEDTTSYKPNRERLCEIWGNLGGANRAAVIIEEVAQFGCDYMKPNQHRTKWSCLVAICYIWDWGRYIAKHPFQIIR